MSKKRNNTEGISEQKTEQLWRKYMRNECSLVELLREIPDEGYRNGYIEYCESSENR